MNRLMKVVIGYDGSECANAALHNLRRAGLPKEADARVISVSELWLPSPPPSGLEVMEASLQSDNLARESSTNEMECQRLSDTIARQGAKLLQEIFPAWQIRAEGCSGSAARQILDQAEQWKADLIVVGSHGRSGLGSFLLGSVSQKIVTEAICSVRVGRCRMNEETSNEHPVKILIGYDGLSDSKAAIDEVSRRNWPKGTLVRLATSVGPFFSGTESDEKFEFANFIQEAAKEKLLVSGLEVSRVVKESDPKHLLLNESKSWNADCIFIGTSNLSRLEKLLLGSISSAVVTRADCSVEVVRSNPTND